MDTTFLRIAATVLGFLCFIGICLWAYSRHAKKGFEEASQLPFTEDEHERIEKDRMHETEERKDHG